LSVNDAMAKFVELLLNEFESDDEEKEWKRKCLIYINLTKEESYDIKIN